MAKLVVVRAAMLLCCDGCAPVAMAARDSAEGKQNTCVALACEARPATDGRVLACEACGWPLDTDSPEGGYTH